MIGKRFRKLIGVGVALFGTWFTPGAWMLLVDPPHGLDRAPALLVGLVAMAIVLGLIVGGGRLIFTPGPEPDFLLKNEKSSSFDEFF